MLPLPRRVGPLCWVSVWSRQVFGETGEQVSTSTQQVVYTNYNQWISSAQLFYRWSRRGGRPINDDDNVLRGWSPIFMQPLESTVVQDWHSFIGWTTSTITMWKYYWFIAAVLLSLQQSGDLLISCSRHCHRICLFTENLTLSPRSQKLGPFRSTVATKMERLSTENRQQVIGNRLQSPTIVNINFSNQPPLPRFRGNTLGCTQIIAYNSSFRSAA